MASSAPLPHEVPTSSADFSMHSLPSSDSDEDQTASMDGLGPLQESATLEETLRSTLKQLSQLSQVRTEIAAVRDSQRLQERMLERIRRQIIELPDLLGSSADDGKPGGMSSTDSAGPSLRSSRRISHFLPSSVAVTAMSPPRLDVEGNLHRQFSAADEAGSSHVPPGLMSRRKRSILVLPSVGRLSRAGSEQLRSAVTCAMSGERRDSSSKAGERRDSASKAGERKESCTSSMSPESAGSRRQSSVRLQLVCEEREFTAESVLHAPERSGCSLITSRESRKSSGNSAFGRGASSATMPCTPNGGMFGGFFDEKLPRRSCTKFVMQPYTNKRLFWDALLILAIIITCLLGTFSAVYLDEKVLTQSNSVNAVAVHIADFIWIFNVLVCLMTGYYSEGALVLDPVRIMRRYARTWLALDLLSCYPFLLVTPEREVLLAFVILKLTRMARILQLFSRLQREYRSTALLPFKVVVTVAIFAHIICCGWHYAQTQSKSSSHLGEREDWSWGDFYVEDAYWVMMTMTTVGYGDVLPVSTASRLYAILTMLLSPVFFGTIVSGLTHVTKEVFADPVEAMVSKATRFMARRGVSQSLQRKVEHNLRQHIQQEHLSAMDPDLVALLSPAVQRELALELLSSTVLKFPLFRTAPYSFIAELATSFCWMLCMSGDIVVEEGQLVIEAQFVMHGRLYIDSSNDDELRRHRRHVDEEGPLEFPVNAWLGEACIFDPNATHVLTATALVDAELAMLQASEYHRIALKYPRVADQQRKLSRAIAEGRASVDQLAYKCKGQDFDRHSDTFGLKRSGVRALKSIRKGGLRRQTSVSNLLS